MNDKTNNGDDIICNAEINKWINKWTNKWTNDISMIHTKNNYVNDFVYKVNNPSKEEIALYGKVIFKYNTRENK